MRPDRIYARSPREPLAVESRHLLPGLIGGFSVRQNVA